MTLIDQSGFQRILKGTAASLSVTLTDGSNAATPGTVTVQVTTSDGTDLKPAGTSATVSGDVASIALSAADTAALDRLTAVWTTSIGTITTYAEIVGNRLFTLNEARSADRAQLSDISAYTDAIIEAARSRIEDAFEQICGLSFIPKLAFDPRTNGPEIYDGNGAPWMELRHRPVITVRKVETRDVGTTTWTAFDADELADVFVDPSGTLQRELGVPFWLARQNVRISYEHGLLQVPFEIKRAALRLLVSSTAGGEVSTNLPERATSFSTQEGTFRLVTPGQRGSYFGLPEVDAILDRYVERTAGIY